MKDTPPKCLKRCEGIDPDIVEPNRTIPTIRTDQAEYLSDKEQLDYFNFRKPFLLWLLRFGKKPDKAKGYSPYTVSGTAHRTARFDYWYWEQNGGYSVPPEQSDATEYMEEVALRDVAESTKGKIQEALLRYSAWLEQKFGREKWGFRWNFQSGGSNLAPRDYLSKPERRKIRQAALQRDGTPAYGTEMDPADADPDSWKYTSMVWVSLDAGLRPVEVGDATVDWCDPESGVLRIPREDSAKNEGNWTVSLTDRTAVALRRWLDERADHPRYADTDKLWLTRMGNRYGSNELRRILHDLCDRAGIDTENRQMSWYTIRHSVGTLMTDERGLAATKAQLRHQNGKTTMKYDNVPVEDRRDALDEMG